MGIKINWCESPAAKARMDKYNITYRLEKRHSLKSIRVQEGLRNQARIHAQLDLEHIDTLEDSAIAGNEFEALVICDDGITMGGNHRVAMLMRLDITHAWAYIATGSPCDIRMFMHTDNYRHGKTESTETRMLQCVQIYNQYPEKWTKAKLAEEYLLKYSEVVRALRADEIRRIFSKNKVSPDWNMDLFYKVGKLEHDEAAMLAVGRLAKTFGYNNKLSTQLINEVNAGKSEQARTKVIDRWQENSQRTATTIGTRRTKTGRKAKSRAGRKAKGQKAHDRIINEALGQNGFADFLLFHNGGKAFQTFDDFGIDTKKEIDDIIVAFNKIIQTLQKIKKSKK